MAKISISSVLEARKRFRLLTVLASLVLILVLFEGLILHNPKSSKAASITDVNNIVSITGNYIVDPNGNIYSITEPTATAPDFAINNTSITLSTIKEVVINSGSTVTFTGGQVDMKSLHIMSNSTITHLGPGKDAESIVIVPGDLYCPVPNRSLCTNGTVEYAERVSLTQALVAAGLIDESGKIYNLNGGTRAINLNISDDLTIEDGGKIDVDEKGFSGGSSLASSDGFGLGNGYNISANDSASGAGHGGLGGGAINEAGDTKKGGIVYDDYLNPTMLGSGGGSGENNHAGGAGGGVVIITANNMVIKSLNADAITADGESTETPGSNKSGGGAGGTVNLVINGSITIPNIDNIITAMGGMAGHDSELNIQQGSIPDSSGKEPGGDGGGGRVAIRASSFIGASLEELGKSSDSCTVSGTPWFFNYNNFQCVNLVKINVRPPRNFNPSVDITGVTGNITIPMVKYMFGNSGTVYVGSSSTANNVKKWLESYIRGGVPKDFNPYALQTDDIIKVNIRVSNLSPGIKATIKDDPLTTSKTALNAKTCVYQSDSDEYTPAGLLVEKPLGSNLTWSFTPTTADPVTITYQCQVE